MIGWIKGNVVKHTKTGVIVNAGGVGYVLHVTVGCAGQLSVDQEVEFSVYTHVSDSAMNLFGFEDDDQMWLFELLISVNGVGPKMAMNILNVGSCADIMGAIAQGDVAFLTQVSGVGKRTAERVVVDLKEKVGAAPVIRNTTHGSKMADVVDALVSMGYRQHEASAVVQNMEDVSEKDVEVLIRDALAQFSR